MVTPPPVPLLWSLCFSTKVRVWCDFCDKSACIIRFLRHKYAYVVIFVWHKCAYVVNLVTQVGFLSPATEILFLKCVFHFFFYTFHVVLGTLRMAFLVPETETAKTLFNRNMPLNPTPKNQHLAIWKLFFGHSKSCLCTFPVDIFCHKT